MHLGAYMKGGTIEVTGNASDWVGAEMTGGLIRIDGNAGGQVGAAYRGSLAGMKGGTILIGGSAGLEVGMRMKRGIIAVGGPVRDFAGLQMKGGTIFLLGGAEIRTGAWMVRGTIVSLAPIPLLPTFAFACAYHPPFLRHVREALASAGIRHPARGPERSLSTLLGRRGGSGEGGDFGLAILNLVPNMGIIRGVMQRLRIEVIDRVYAAILAAKSPAERSRHGCRAHRTARMLVEAGVRYHHPEWTEAQIQLRSDQKDGAWSKLSCCVSL